MQEIAIYGAGGFARELAWLVRTCIDAEALGLVAFVDDDPAKQGRRVDGVDVWSLEELRDRRPEARVVGGVGDPAMRARVMAKADAAGFGTHTLVHAAARMSERVDLGPGTVICAGTTITTGVRIGRHVQVNLHCTIGHDAVLEDYATLAPGVHVSGCVHIGRGAYLGAGAVVIQGTAEASLTIGAGAVVGAGACVVRPVAPGTTVVGVPARVLKGG